MSPRSIRVERLAKRFMPRLWAFAYPPSGRGLYRVRLAAMRVWAWLFARHWRRSEGL